MKVTTQMRGDADYPLDMIVEKMPGKPITCAGKQIGIVESAIKDGERVIIVLDIPDEQEALGFLRPDGELGEWLRGKLPADEVRR